MNWNDGVTDARHWWAQCQLFSLDSHAFFIENWVLSLQKALHKIKFFDLEMTGFQGPSQKSSQVIFDLLQVKSSQVKSSASQKVFQVKSSQKWLDLPISVQFGLLNGEGQQISHVLRINQRRRILFCDQTTKKLPSIVGLLGFEVELRGHTAFVFARCSAGAHWSWRELMKPSETLTDRWEEEKEEFAKSCLNEHYSQWTDTSWKGWSTEKLTCDQIESSARDDSW